MVLISPGYVKSELYQVDNRGRRHPDTLDAVPAALRMSAERAARLIVSAVARRRSEVVITAHGKGAVFLQRHVPWLVSFGVKTFRVKGRRPEWTRKATDEAVVKRFIEAAVTEGARYPRGGR